MPKFITRCPICKRKIDRIVEKVSQIRVFNLTKSKQNSKELNTELYNNYLERKFACPSCKENIADEKKEVKKILGIKINELEPRFKRQATHRLKEIMAKFRNNKRSNLFNRVVKIRKQITKKTDIPPYLPHEAEEELTQMIIKDIMKVMSIPT